MAKRIKIGIPFSNNANWIGGTYYIINLINSLNKLDDFHKPLITIFADSGKDFDIVTQNTQYPYLTYYCTNLKFSFLQRLINLFSRILFKYNAFEKRPKSNQIDFLFPAINNWFYGLVNNKIFWIPDLQEHCFPEFFPQEEIDKRLNYNKYIIENDFPIVFSSMASQKDFQKFFPNAKNKTFVLNFSVCLPAHYELDFQELKSRFNIYKPYFITPNQFWQHKNHKVIIEAMKFLKDTGNFLDFQIIFTGKEFDFRNAEYAECLKKSVTCYNLEQNIIFCGFVSRFELLTLIKNCICIVQPSLFEGWSTAVEDAKALGKHVVASNISVHQEQLGPKASYFDPADKIDLAKKLLNFKNSPPQDIQNDYSKKTTGFGKNFISILEIIKENNFGR